MNRLALLAATGPAFRVLLDGIAQFGAGQAVSISSTPTPRSARK